MLEVVDKALEKDMINNVLKYDKKKDIAKSAGLCSYLLDVSKMCFNNEEGAYVKCVDCIIYGKFKEWLKDNYTDREGYIYPEYNEWGKRLKVLELYKTHLESLIKKT